MIEKQVDDITKADIDRLIEHKVLESKTLEYKELLKIDGNEDKKEFLADVASFGNSSGGDIIFGLKGEVVDGEKTGAASAVVPIPGTSADSLKLKVESIIRDNIEPRLQVHVQEIGGFGEDSSGFILMIRVPKSYASPHMLRQSHRFYARNSAGKYILDVDEIRTAILASDSQAERVTRFRLDRLAKIAADETPVSLGCAARIALHLIPLSTFLNNEVIQLGTTETVTRDYPLIGGHVQHSRYNLDGVVSWRTGIGSYCQAFRTGVVESVWCDDVNERDGSLWLYPSYEGQVLIALETYLTSHHARGIRGGVVVALSLIGMNGAKLRLSDMDIKLLERTGRLHAIDRDLVVLPDIMIDQLPCKELAQAMKPAFDAVWNACGHERSQNYTPTGDWAPRSW